METYTTPPLRHRLASLIYEAMLLFGLLFVAGWLFSTLLQHSHTPYLRQALQYWLLLVAGIYFVWFWSHGGQTLAMKTWRMRVVTTGGLALSIRHAICRYLLAWLWFGPGLLLAWLLGARAWMLLLIPAVNMLIWALTIYLDPQRQFLHDRIAGTRLIRVTRIPPKGQQPH